MRWWKTLFIHPIDIVVVNSFILFKEHQSNNPDDEALHRLKDYPLCGFREEIERQLCDFPEYEEAPSNTKLKPTYSLEDFETIHVPEYVQADDRRRCVVCYKQGRSELKVNFYCSAPQCKGKFMHTTKDKNCFRVFHSREYQRS